MQILLGTTNKGKIIEISDYLSSLSIKITTPMEQNVTDSPFEHGDTFVKNAMEKARFYYEKTGLPTLADDSGIIVEALTSELGVHTRRWGAGKDASDEEWIVYFLQRMGHEINKRAHFVCVLVYIDAHGHAHEFEGKCSGVITDTLEADYLPGLPISACFKPDGYEKVYSALTVEQKNAVSHRGLALGLFKNYLASVL